MRFLRDENIFPDSLFLKRSFERCRDLYTVRSNDVEVCGSLLTSTPARDRRTGKQEEEVEDEFVGPLLRRKKPKSILGQRNPSLRPATTKLHRNQEPRGNRKDAVFGSAIHLTCFRAAISKATVTGFDKSRILDSNRMGQ